MFIKCLRFRPFRPQNKHGKLRRVSDPQRQAMARAEAPADEQLRPVLRVKPARKLREELIMRAEDRPDPRQADDPAVRDIAELALRYGLAALDGADPDFD